MAQLYKMTLYVCDLENNLSLDEIKTLIDQDALNGVAVNCACHFADEQTGPQVDGMMTLILIILTAPLLLGKNILRRKQND